MDVISLPVEYDHKKIDGKYRLVAIAAQRAKALSFGAKPKIQSKARKITTIAIEEAAENQLEFVTGEEAVKAREEASKFDYRKLLEETRKTSAAEDLSELEKDLKVYLHEREMKDKRAFDELFSEKKEEETEDSSEE